MKFLIFVFLSYPRLFGPAPINYYSDIHNSVDCSLGKNSRELSSEIIHQVYRVIEDRSRSRCRHARRQLMPPPPPLMLQVVPISKEGETENKKTTHWHHHYDDIYIRVRSRIYTYVRACIQCSVCMSRIISLHFFIYVCLYVHVAYMCASTCSSVYSYFICNYINFVLYYKYIRTYLYIPTWSMRKCTCRHARTRSCICICYIYK